MEEENIYPIFDRMLSRKDKEELLGQRGVMLWLTGLSGSGKSTIAIALALALSTSLASGYLSESALILAAWSGSRCEITM